MEAGQLLKASFISDMTDRLRSLSAGPLDVHSSSGSWLPGSMGVVRSPLHPPVSSPVPLQMSQQRGGEDLRNEARFSSEKNTASHDEDSYANTMESSKGRESLQMTLQHVTKLLQMSAQRLGLDGVKMKNGVDVIVGSDPLQMSAQRGPTPLQMTPIAGHKGCKKYVEAYVTKPLQYCSPKFCSGVR